MSAIAAAEKPAVTAANDIDGNPTRAAGGRSRRVWIRRVLLIVLPAIALLGGGGFYLHGGRFVETENAYVKADKVPISADVGGSILEVPVQENQRVAKGDLLFRIDPESYRLAVDMARANLEQVRADLMAMKADYEAKLSEIDLARTKYGFARKEQDRQKALANKNYASKAQLDAASEEADIDAQQIVTLQKDLRRIEESLGGDVDAPVENHPSYLAAKAALDKAEYDLRRTEVRAPADGIVSKLPKAGQYTDAGDTVLALVQDNTMWIEANFTETELTHVREGQPVSIRIDTYPDRVWTGSVESLSPATGSEFSVLPAQNATGNWVKVVQRVPVRIRIEDRDGEPVLRAGLSAIVEIDTGYKRELMGYSL